MAFFPTAIAKEPPFRLRFPSSHLICNSLLLSAIQTNQLNTMKHRLQLTLVCLGLLTTVVSWSQVTLPPSGNNQKSEVTQYMGLVKVTIVYSSPDVAGRES